MLIIHEDLQKSFDILGEGIKINNSIRTIKFSSLENVSFNTFFSTIKDNKSLIRLNFVRISFENEIGESLFDLFKVHENLSYLEFNDCNLYVNDYKLISKIVEGSFIKQLSITYSKFLILLKFLFSGN